eukprot:CAMPEP_0185024304 /NCGR_PEP_ID=MMETSP1103-20130426/7328_1 /TAXON_ID=36769 /ORGANISM="Paraphysomonas bandaiensis, Strain Caron Lab Isolate" /LENGTH=163 /DNA_ID=CAMNT_0027557231 /DNA_START=113 /DNA_END=604 /DNA_ORIENTATION=+
MQPMKIVTRNCVTTLKTNTYKQTTAIVGLAVDTDARNTLMRLTSKCLASVERAPADCGYRKSVEEWMHFIQKGVLMSEDVKTIEDFIDQGQIEEVIEKVQDEITLADEYIAQKGWEAVEEAQEYATKWYEFKMEDLHYTNTEVTRVEDEMGTPAAASTTEQPK